MIELLREVRVDAIDVAPARYFNIANPLPEGEGSAVRAKWEAAGIEIIGMQAVWHGLTPLNFFTSRMQGEEMVSIFRRAAKLASELGARTITFGSPRNRDRGGIDMSDATAIARDFFFRLGDEATSVGVCVCLEANPALYGCNFLTTTAEAAEFLMGLGHPFVRLQFDTSTVIANQECEDELRRALSVPVGHSHVSDPGLSPVGSGDYHSQHQKLSSLVREIIDPQFLTLEMNEPSGPKWRKVIRDSIDYVRRVYFG